MKKLKYLLLILPFIFISNVKADTITNYSTNYYYYQENVGAHSTGYRSGSNNKVTLGGTDNQGNNFDYLYGAISDINYPISKGTRYSAKICLRYSSLGDNEFNENNFNRFNDINLTYGSPQIEVEAVSSVYDITQPLLLQADVCSTYNFIAKQSNNSFAIGFRSDSYNSFGVYRHQYNISVSVYSVDVFEGTTSIQPIIDQNNIIINQNQSIINNQTDINNSINNVDDTLKDDNVNVSESSITDNSASVSDSPISDLLILPIKLLTNISNGLQGTCTSFNLGSLFGTDLILPCINLESRLGSFLWGLIDSLFCIFLIYNVGMLAIKIWTDVIMMKDVFSDLYKPSSEKKGGEKK